jgi:hypothetical protein
MAKDLFHEEVREALVKDGWTITHDPFEMRPYNPAWEIDFGAERIIEAEKGIQKIAVEVKSFLASSFANEFHKALGQYLDYRSGLKRIDKDRLIYLAVPFEVYDIEFNRIGIVNVMEDYDVQLIIFDPLKSVIVEWKR